MEELNKAEIERLGNLLSRFIAEYGTDLTEDSTYTETDKIFVSDVETKISELI